MPAPKLDGLPPGIRKRSTAKAPGFVYEVFFYSPVYGDRSERVGTDLREAKRRLADRRREVKEGTFQPGGRSASSITVADFATGWLDERERDGVKTIKDNRRVFDLHIVPVLGTMAVGTVEAKHVVDLLAVLRQKKSARGTPLAKNTIRNVHALLVTMFNDAEQRGYTVRNPCHGLRASQKPKKAPRHETQKPTFTVPQIEALIFDARIPLDRRVLYAVQFFTGTRFGEAAGLRWHDYAPAIDTLGKMRIERQYDDAPLKGRRNEPGAPRTAPVHPTLAAILDAWKREGFASFFGREPKPDDFIAPSREQKCRSLRHSARKLSEDAARVGIEGLREATHPFRSAFKTIALANGAAEVWIERIIHNASGGVAAAYLMDDWSALCRAVLAIPVHDPRPPVVAPAVISVEPSGVIVLADVLASDAQKDETPAWAGVSSAGWTGLEEGGDRARPPQNRSDRQVGNLGAPVENRPRSGTPGVVLAHARTLVEAAQVLRDGGRSDLASAVLLVVVGLVDRPKV